MADFRLLQQVSRANLERDVRFLSTRWPTRHTLSRHHDEIAAYLLGRFKALGYASEFHHYTHSGKALKNVVAVHPKKPLVEEKPAPIVVVCAHFDSRQEDLRNPEAPAPGADDNATGVAVVLELARLIKTLALPVHLRFVLFSGEEQNEWGSHAFVADVAKWNPKARSGICFNLDQIGYPSKTREIFVDRDERGLKSNNSASDAIVKNIVALARDVVKVPTKIDPVEASDYEPFEAIGWTVVGLYEGEYRYPHYHKSTDTFDKVDFAYVTDMARLSLAWLLSMV